MSITTTTELDAVNTMLSAIGADPVSSLATTTDADVTQAQNILNEVIREVLSEGWDFNTDLKYPMARTAGNEYVVPSNMLSIDVSDDFPYIRTTLRQGKVWDQTNFTFTWTVDLTFNVVWLFEFEELPEVARKYIALKAARKFQARTVGSTTLDGFTEKDEMDARADFIDAESTDAEHNILTGNYDVYRTLDRWV